jgi:hypothetical protein
MHISHASHAAPLRQAYYAASRARLEKTTSHRVQEAARNGDYNLLVHLVDETNVENVVSGKTKNSFKGRPLHYAAEGGCPRCVSYLLVQCGANVDVRTRGGWTPLMYAVAENNLAVCVLLIENNADIEALHLEGYYKEVMSFSGVLGVKDCYHCFDDGSDNAQQGCSALLLALQSEDEACARLLIDKGADISNVRLNVGQGALLYGGFDVTQPFTGLDVIPSWVHLFIAQRDQCRHAAIVFLGSLQSGRVTVFKGNGKDVAIVLSQIVWQSRMDQGWFQEDHVNTVKNTVKMLKE